MQICYRRVVFQECNLLRHFTLIEFGTEEAKTRNQEGENYFSFNRAKVTDDHDQVFTYDKSHLHTIEDDAKYHENEFKYTVVYL